MTSQIPAAVGTPLITELQVVPVAGQDSMLLNLSGAHGPYFTRNILILKDSAGHVGVGEVPGGEGIRKTLEDARSMLVGQPVGNVAMEFLHDGRPPVNREAVYIPPKESARLADSAHL